MKKIELTPFFSVSGIILAAGFSSRMKTTKALLKISDKTFLENIFSKLNDCVTEVIVVLGHRKEEILSGVKLPGAKIVFNDRDFIWDVCQAGKF